MLSSDKAAKIQSGSHANENVSQQAAKGAILHISVCRPVSVPALFSSEKKNSYDYLFCDFKFSPLALMKQSGSV